MGQLVAMIRSLAVTVLLVIVGTYTTLGQTDPTFLGFKNGQACQCECECPTPSSTKCQCDCDCPRPGSSCGPGFTQVCPSPDGNCPDDYMPLCPEDLTAAGRADLALEEDRDAYSLPSPYSFVCQGKTHKCSFDLDFAPDCSSITKAKPSCTPKKTKCNKKTITFPSGDKDMRCLVTGTYKNTGKKQSFTGFKIATNPDYTKTTTTTTTTAPPTPAAKDYNCQCVPDFMLYMGQMAMATNRNGFMGSCVCVAGMMEV